MLNKIQYRLYLEYTGMDLLEWGCRDGESTPITLAKEGARVGGANLLSK
jgi:hypothetical protein